MANTNEVRQLKFPENVRTRFGMYIGDANSCDVVLRESSDNNVDEMLSGHADKTWIFMLNEGKVPKGEIRSKYYVTADNGRGIPISEAYDEDKDVNGNVVKRTPMGITQCQLAVGTLHAGSKFDKDFISTGLNGVGISCFLPDTLVRVCNEDNEWYNIKICDLAKEISEGKLRYTNCMTPEGVAKTRIVNCWETKKVKEYLSLEFELKSGSKFKIECTPEHQWQLADGTYIRADELTENSNLMESNLDFKLSDILSRSVNLYGASVYRIYNTINNKSYIGSFQDSLLARFIDSDWFSQSHATKIKECDYHPLYRDIRDLGINNFRVEILESIHEYNDSYAKMIGVDHSIRDKLHEAESNYIKLFDSVNTGYNLSESGNFEGCGKAGALANKFRGTSRFNSEYQIARSEDSLRKSCKRIYNELKSNSLELNEVNWNSKRIHSNEITYRNVVYNLQWYIDNNCIPESDRVEFTESRFDYNSYELLELNGIPHGRAKQAYTGIANLFYSIKDLYGEFNKDNLADWYRKNKSDHRDCRIEGKWNTILSRLNLCIACKLIKKEDVPKELLNEITQ